MQHFKHVDTWVFDMDNTLYDAEKAIFPAMEVLMNKFVAQTLRISAEAANIERDRFYKTYGTTLRGLMTEHDVRPEAFLEATHDIDVSVVPACLLTRDGLAQLPGRKIVFTNAARHFAEKMLRQLDLHTSFDTVFTIEDAAYQPKPKMETYKLFLGQTAVSAATSCMFEDMTVNLKTAHDLGMTTVWCHGPSQDPLKEKGQPYIHHIHPSLADWIEKTL